MSSEITVVVFDVTYEPGPGGIASITTAATIEPTSSSVFEERAWVFWVSRNDGTVRGSYVVLGNTT